MLTLYHSPQSRSSAIMALLDEMGIADRIDVRRVTIPRMDGSGARDHANPHPEGKVPALVHDGHVITERAAIILQLTSLFPSPMAPVVASAEWGEFVAECAKFEQVGLTARVGETLDHEIVHPSDSFRRLYAP